MRSSPKSILRSPKRWWKRSSKRRRRCPPSLAGKKHPRTLYPKRRSTDPVRESGFPAATLPRAGLLLAVALSLLWRLPSFFDPPWVNDEGTNFAIAQAMAHGLRLYAQVWENKPPALYLLYEAVYHSVGASLPVIRGLSTIAVVVTTLLVTSIAS